MGKKKQQRLIDIISKVARIYAPSIIFLDAGEKPWLKKVPPQEKHLKPKRFANYFGKLMRDIKPGDQVKLQRLRNNLLFILVVIILFLSVTYFFINIAIVVSILLYLILSASCYNVLKILRH